MGTRNKSGGETAWMVGYVEIGENEGQGQGGDPHSRRKLAKGDRAEVWKESSRDVTKSYSRSHKSPGRSQPRSHIL